MHVLVVGGGASSSLIGVAARLHQQVLNYQMMASCAVLMLISAATSLVPGPWSSTKLQPADRAAKLLEAMTLDEKFLMLHGPPSGNPAQCAHPTRAECAYVGNVASNSRLGIPPLNMNDGPQGFRNPFGRLQGTSTAWPSGLTMAASWDRDAVEVWGIGMGKEFRAKGSNVQLGPGLCLARVPRNGRNFEYLSGEDPYLGYELAQSAVRGIQSQGVIANAKHWVLNNQETNRGAVYEIASERVRFEIYYPPFAGAVRAGVGSVMCSYNKVVGDLWSCEDESTLRVDLKGRLNFSGFVMSDWGATHSTSIASGLDVEMPAARYMNGSMLAKAMASGGVTRHTIDDSLLRILTPMFALGVMDAEPSTWDYRRLQANVTTDEAVAAARHLSAASTVLLRNEGGLLPIAANAVRSLAVIGFAAANNSVVHAGGSGSVAPSYIANPLDAIRAAAAAASPPISVTYDSGADLARAAALARRVDVSIVFVQTLSGEGWDRPSLSLDDACAHRPVCHQQNALVAAVAAAASGRVAVVMSVPGAVLTPWRDEVAAILVNFMPGQQAGNAIADVLFGTTNPTAKLPLTFPSAPNQTALSPEQWPGLPNPKRPAYANYTEGLLVGYRYYDANGLAPAFPFGHGLSYTAFSYADLAIEAGGRAITFTLTNEGARAGAEVAQLYLEFPAAAGEPPRVLKRFVKSATLAPGESQAIVFEALDPGFDLAIWDEHTHGWRGVKGEFGVLIGSSSRDIRLKGRFVIV